MNNLAALRDWLARAPAGTSVDAAALAALLDEVTAAPAAAEQPQAAPLPWRVLLWTAPAETRIGRAELLEAVGRPQSWLYRHTGPKAKQRIPHRKLDGELVFVAGEVRAWLKAHETIIEAGPLDLAPGERPMLRTAS